MEDHLAKSIVDESVPNSKILNEVKRLFSTFFKLVFFI
jgi:hypothetical protein